MWRQLTSGFRLTLVLTVLTGLIYPALVTGLGRWLFPYQANGSLVSVNGRIVGSSLIGQNFAKAEYFHSRPSAAGSDAYDATASGGSNYGPTNQKLIDRVKDSVALFRKENPAFTGAIPADLVTASASGLDPDISPASAGAQVLRVAKARGIAEAHLRQLIREDTEGRTLEFLGEPRINVLRLNLDLDRRFPLR